MSDVLTYLIGLGIVAIIGFVGGYLIQVAGRRR